MTRTRPGQTQEEVRRHNLSTVLSFVHVHGPTSRAGLTAAIGLNRSTIGGLTAELTAVGLVSERSPDTVAGDAAVVGPRSVGRPSYVVVPCSERAQVIAVDLRATYLQIARIGLGGVVLERLRPALVPAAETVERVVDELVGQIGGLVEGLRADDLCLGLAASVPALVRGRDGLVRAAPNLGWVDVPLADLLSRRLGMPVLVGNDADLGARAEHMRGAAIGHDDVIYVHGEVGVGAGVLVGGRPLAGRSGYGGEAGHLLMDPAGRRCQCGARGCWETTIGLDAILRSAGRPTGGGREAFDDVVAAHHAGDEQASEALACAARWLGRGSAALANLLDPAMFVYGGVLGIILQEAREQARAAMEAGSLVAQLEPVEMEPAALGEDASLLGAAELGFEALLADPLGTLSQRTA